MHLIKNILFIITFLGLSFFSEAQDLYLIVGQSNAAGRGSLPSNLQSMAGVKVLDDSGAFIDALPNLNQYSTIQKTTITQGYNLGYTFGAEMHQHSGQEIRLVVNARGGTSIVNWFPGVIDDIPGTSYFDEAISRVQEALTNYPDSELKGILWHQGESNRNRALYMSELSDLIGHFRSELGDVPFIAGQLSYERSDNDTFNANLTTINDLVDMTSWVSAAGLTTTDLTHFTATATQVLGERYAEEMQQVIIDEENPCGEELNTVYSISDSYIKLGDPDDNYGSDIEILVKKSNSGSNDRIGYVYFPPSATTDIQDYDQILLKLTSTGSATPNVRLQVLGNNFVDESILTWNNQPTTEFEILYGAASCGDEYYFDVTDYLKTTSATNPGFKLSTGEITSSTMRFGSKENPDEMKRPQLIYLSTAASDIPTFQINDHSVNTIEEGSFLSKRINEKNNYMDSVNQYGGLSNCNFQFSATGYFRTEKVNDTWYIVDPDGHRFFSAGVNSVKNGGGMDHVMELKNLGFNTFGSWSDEPISNMPYCPRFNVLVNYKNTDQRLKDMFVDHRILPVFEPNFQSWVQSAVVSYVAPYLNDQWVLGYFIDNELPFYKEQLFECLSFLDTTDPQYIEAENYMINTFGINWDISQITQDHEDIYKGHVAETYYSIVSQAIKAADPNHLLLGTRINASAKYTSSVIEAAGNHTDILTINYYKVWEPEDETIEMYDDVTDVPWMVTEFYTKGADSGLLNEGGAGWEVPTQAERASYFENFVLKLMTDPNCVGYHWFRHQDDLESNKGLLDEYYNWYQPLVESATELNEAKYALRDQILNGVVNHECDCNSTFDFTETNEACDDGDPCTSGETYDSDCNCNGGILIDANNNGICDSDEIELPIPSPLTVTNNSLTIFWDDSEVPISDVLLQYKVKDALDWISLSPINNFTILNGLSECTIYECRLASTYIDDLFSETIEIETLGCQICDAINNVFDFNATDLSVILAWDVVVGSIYEFNYKAASASDWISFETSFPVAILFGLNSCEMYEWHVNVVCDSDDYTSPEIHTFQTTCKDGLNNSDLAIRLFPNPTSNELNVSSLFPITQIDIIDYTGRIHISKLISESNKETIDISGLSNAAYMVKIIGKDDSTIRPLIIRK